MQKITFSVLIPHKNRPQLLERAIHSVPKRDDVQIIVVDDNSDPEIVDFDHFPCIDEPNVEVYFTKEGKGAGYARNVGLPHVKGKWLTIIGSDDYFTDEMPALMDKVADRQEDVIFFNATAICEPSLRPSNRCDYINERVDNTLKTNDYTELLLTSNDAVKFFRMDFVREHNLTFHEVRWGNDAWFCDCVAYYAQTYYAFPDKAYCITESDGSLLMTASLESYLCRMNEALQGIKLIRNKFQTETIYFYLMAGWKRIWKFSKWEAVKLMPKVIYCGGGKMIPYFKTFFSHLIKNKFKNI